MKFKNKTFIIILCVTCFSLNIWVLLSYYNAKHENASGCPESMKKTVIIDAGHGGNDSGAVAPDGTLEKTINLEIAEKLSCILKLYGCNVVMTRTDDNSIHDKNADTIREKKISDIRNREKIINKHKDAVFISIHQNEYSDSSASGSQVFYSKNNPLSKNLAENIQQSIINSIQKNNYRKIKPSGTEIYLLYHSAIPSVMVECGFVSNINDLNNIKNQKYQTEISQCIAQGLIKYLIEQDETNGIKG